MRKILGDFIRFLLGETKKLLDRRLIKMDNKEKQTKKKGLRDFARFFFGERKVELHAIPEESRRWKILEKPEGKEKEKPKEKPQDGERNSRP